MNKLTLANTVGVVPHVWAQARLTLTLWHQRWLRARMLRRIEMFAFHAYGVTAENFNANCCAPQLWVLREQLAKATGGDPTEVSAAIKAVTFALALLCSATLGFVVGEIT